jgi:HNH endonuclease
MLRRGRSGLTGRSRCNAATPCITINASKLGTAEAFCTPARREALLSPKHWYQMSISTPRPVATLMQYGVTKDFAVRVHGLDLTVTTIRNTSIANLVSKYKLSEDEAQELKRCVVRDPIEPAVMNALLSRSNFTCCVCKGTKGLSFVIHHIVAYEQTQDNSYNNLIVVCPADHDLAHQAGLSLRITPDQLRSAKAAWEKTVKTVNAGRAVQWDFISMVDEHLPPQGALGVERSELVQTREMSHLLREKFPSHLRPEITSVQFIQRHHRCSLEITTVKKFSDGLEDETSTRTDLGFISSGPGSLFSPDRPIDENLSRFMSDMDEVSIINCTDLFKKEVEIQIERRWRGLDS